MNFIYDGSGNLTAQVAEDLVAPRIIRGPLTRVASPGDTATFSVSLADTEAVAFQWNFNGTDLPGATMDSLALVEY